MVPSLLSPPGMERWLLLVGVVVDVGREELPPACAVVEDEPVACW
jgi:hypothetical protein